MTPEAVVKRQVIAYNKRNIKDFVACHHPEVCLYNFQDKTPFAQGREQIESIYKDVFDASPELHTEITQRMLLGNTIIDNEIVTGRKGNDTLKIIAIYEIKDGLIFKAHFIRE